MAKGEYPGDEKSKQSQPNPPGSGFETTSIVDLLVEW